MDADDVARPDRLERQVALLGEASDVVLTASLCDTIDGTGRRLRQLDLWRLARASCFVPFPHTSVMFRRSVFDAVGGYRRECDYWEDLDFFLRVVACGRVAVIADNLVSHRESAASSRVVPADQERIESAVSRMYDCLSVFAGGGRYDALIAGAAAEAGAQRVQPMTLVSIHSNRLWAGERPRIAMRMLRRARLGFNRQSMLALGWATAAQLSPRMLRTLLRGVARLRNFAARDRIHRGEVYEWRPHIRGGSDVRKTNLAPFDRTAALPQSRPAR
jgi:GT2 family glycosyltransferase